MLPLSGHMISRARAASRRSLRALAALFLVLAMLAPSSARAGEPSGIEKAIDAGAGLIVTGLGAILFYPVFTSTAEVEGQGVVDGESEVQALVDRLAGEGLDVESANMTLTLPAEVSDDKVAELQQSLRAHFVPTYPKGIRNFTVAKGEGSSTKLAGTAGGLPIIALWLLVGAVFFTFRMGFINLRGFRHAIEVVRGRFDNPDDEGEVSHFQALSSALSATVGLGNIAGVAIAVAVGGPGAILWMVFAGFLGMSSKFAECTLGQKYREVDNGEVRGGPMFYLEKGLAEKGLGPLGKVLGALFAVLCIGGSLGGGNTFQVSQSLGILREQVTFLADYGWVYGAVLTVLVGIVILGGIQRIAATAEKIVPLMCGMYVLVCLYILFANAAEIPGAFGKIFGMAFTPEAGYGGLLGVLVTGLRRAAFSNEAGVGSAAIAHSAARTEYPIREGVVALLEPFIDTIVVCTMTGLVIVITGAYAEPGNFDVIASANGAALTGRAMGSVVSWFPYLLSIAVVLFAYSTMISWSYYGERCAVYLGGPKASLPYKIVFLIFVFLGSVITAGNILNFGDLMILSMAFPNILGVMILSGDVRKDLDSYWSKLGKGEFKVYK